MLQLLTKYLLRYKRVVIPHIGTIEFVEQPAQLNFSDKLIQPPGFTAAMRPGGTLSSHQLTFLALALEHDVDHVRKELTILGEKIREKHSAGKFTWIGVGTFSSDQFIQAVECPFIPVPAEKAIRKNAEHAVLVGDKATSSREIAETAIEKKKYRPSVLVIGWIVLALALIIIVYLLYSGKFSIYASGLQTAP